MGPIGRSTAKCADTAVEHDRRRRVRRKHGDSPLEALYYVAQGLAGEPSGHISTKIRDGSV
jgi:hypothetical protein